MLDVADAPGYDGPVVGYTIWHFVVAGTGAVLLVIVLIWRKKRQARIAAPKPPVAGRPTTAPAKAGIKGPAPPAARPKAAAPPRRPGR